MSKFDLYLGDSRDVLKTLPSESVDCCITSPPFYGLRDYGTGKWIGGDENCPHVRVSKFSESCNTGHKNYFDIGGVGDGIYKSVCALCGAVREDKQIGLEETPHIYISQLVDIFSEVRRVLKKDGTLWVNIGDTYNTSSYKKDEHSSGNGKQGTNKGVYENVVERPMDKTCKPKDLIGIPWMLAFALRDKCGYYLRQDIIFGKVNPMPEAVTDRCTRSHEYVFLCSNSNKYYFNSEAMQERSVSGSSNDFGQPSMRNKRDVWMLTPSNYHGSHFATFPKALIEPMILAGSRENGTVLDVFNGSGTTGIVANNYNRNYIGIELNPKYAEITRSRVMTESAGSEFTIHGEMPEEEFSLF